MTSNQPNEKRSAGSPMPAATAPSDDPLTMPLKDFAKWLGEAMIANLRKAGRPGG